VPGEESGDTARRGAAGVGVPAAGHGTGDGAGEVAVRVGEGGGDERGVGDGVHPVVGGVVGGVEVVRDRVEVLVLVGEFQGVADCPVQPGGRGDHPQAGGEAVVDVVGAGRGPGDDGRDEHSRVDAVGGVGEGGVPVRLLGRGGRVAGVGPAVHVGSDEGADPLPEGVAVAGRVRGFQAGEQVAV